MLTKSEFFNRKIFLKDKISSLRRQYSEQIADINSWSKCEEYESIQNIKSYFLNKKNVMGDKFRDEISFEFVEQIANWRIKEEKVCHYCGISEAALQTLSKQDGFINKRGQTRGKSLEIDRMNSCGSYGDATNLKLACYWCNNAKTDTFTYNEFREIGKAINKIWEKRLGLKFVIPV